MIKENDRQGNEPILQTGRFPIFANGRKWCVEKDKKLKKIES